MLSINKQSPRPVYEQIIEQIEHLILSGSIAPDEQIPSVRSLSLELSVNPNTIQKAYNELEIRKITYSVPGVGRYVATDARKNIGSRYKNKLNGIYESSYWLALAGIEKGLVTETVDRAYRSVNNFREEDGAK